MNNIKTKEGSPQSGDSIQIIEPNKEFWRSVHEFNKGKPEFDPTLSEFSDSVKEEFAVDKLTPLSRRKFMALLGASSAFAMAACNNYRDKGEIISYNSKPEYANFGDAVFYASTLNDGTGVLVKTREGRPIKIDGNPDHPVFKGKVGVYAQAGILNLYDPERIKNPLKKSGSQLILNKNDRLKVKWIDADKDIIENLNKANTQGKEIAIVTHSVISPTQKKLFDDFIAKYPTTKIYSYELHHDNNRRAAWKECFGTEDVPSIKWDEAKIILSLEADFLGNEGIVTENIRKFASSRNVENLDNFSRLYSVEAGMSLTGLNSDYRFRITPENQLDFVKSLINEISKKVGKGLGTWDLGQTKSLELLAKENSLDIKKLNYLVKDLVENKGKSIVYAGEKLPKNVHSAVNLLNELLENRALYDFNQLNTLQMQLTGLDGLKEDLKNGKIGVLINFDANPVYHNNFNDKLFSKLDLYVSLLELQNESGINSHYLLPINHSLESWNDFSLKSGVISLQQPVIAPLYDTRQKEAILLTWISGQAESYNEDMYHQYLIKRWETDVFPASNTASNFSKFWNSGLHDGCIELPSTEQPLLNFTLNNLPKMSKKTGFTVILSRNYSIGDGRYSNNGWLQELPHPVSKSAWDNYAAVSPKTAKDLGVENYDVVEVDVHGRRIELPVILQPGMADNVIQTELGYGRTNAGEVGNNVGVNANLLLGNDGISQWIYTGAKITKTDKTYPVYSTQEHHAVDETFVKDFHFERDIIRETTVDEYKKNKNVLKKEIEILNINADKKYTGVKWAMAIDMNKCVSCNVCVTSCNVENNIPVVGKEQVGKGREMQWIRLDRYYSGTPEEPKISIQPMLCQHCDNAPCENVCPVAATNHSDDGLNQMVYNRCVGTRYCSNNCPFKVRRYNFFNFRSEFKDGFYQNDSIELVQNPEVTVRSRGVMEKCTFCVQRIMEGRQNATKNGTPLVGTDVRTACQDACPAEAIKFGDMNDSESEIAKLREHNLAYYVLEALNIKPNVTYIAKLRNTYTEEV